MPPPITASLSGVDGYGYGYGYGKGNGPDCSTNRDPCNRPSAAPARLPCARKTSSALSIDHPRRTRTRCERAMRHRFVREAGRQHQAWIRMAQPSRQQAQADRRGFGSQRRHGSGVADRQRDGPCRGLRHERGQQLLCRWPAGAPSARHRGPQLIDHQAAMTGEGHFVSGTGADAVASQAAHASGDRRCCLPSSSRPRDQQQPVVDHPPPSTARRSAADRASSPSTTTDDE